MFEGHHKVLLSQLTSETESTIDNIVLLCSNCHSMIHRKKECLSVEELKQIVEERRRLSSV
ncbi:HNH endonuclease [Parageobacillus thermoglucosidasius]|uniref:HNH endonuclease n=1 Tax=Parageobacillus thermoglucosidasius TaxID=1426 RepID=UPI0009C17A75